MPPTPRGSFRWGRKKYSSHHALYLACQSGSWASQAAFIAAWKATASGKSCCAGRPAAASGRRRRRTSPWWCTMKRVFMCTAGTRGLRMWAISEMPVAKKRGSSSAPGMFLRHLRREGPEHGGGVHADLLEEAAVHQAHHAAAAARALPRLAARTGRARPSIERRRAPRPPAPRRRRRFGRAGISNHRRAVSLRVSMTEASGMSNTALLPDHKGVKRPRDRARLSGAP